MKKQAEQIEITDDIIRNKFDEILSGKDIEEQQIMGFNNIDKVKRYEFLRENFVQEVKNTISEDGVSDNHLFSYFCDIVYNDIFKIAKDPVTVIYEAITKNDINLVKALLTNLEVNPNAEFNKYSTLLEVACTENNKDIVKLLLEKGAYINPPVQCVIQAGNLDMLEFLLENGADPNYMEEKIFSCLQTAVLNINVAMVAKLLAYGANMEDTVFERLTYLSNENWTQTLQDKQNKIDMIKVFLQYGANPDVEYSKGQMIKDMEAVYEPLRALLTLESAFRRNDYTAIKDIDKKDLAAFVKWKSEVWPVIKDDSKGKFEYIKNLSGLDKFSKQVSLDSDDSIEQSLIKLREKIDKLGPSLKFSCLLKIADIIKGDVEGQITFDDELTYNTTLDLLKKSGFQVDVTGETGELLT